MTESSVVPCEQGDTHVNGQKHGGVTDIGDVQLACCSRPKLPCPVPQSPFGGRFLASQGHSRL